MLWCCRQCHLVGLRHACDVFAGRASCSELQSAWSGSVCVSGRCAMQRPRRRRSVWLTNPSTGGYAGSILSSLFSPSLLFHLHSFPLFFCPSHSAPLSLPAPIFFPLPLPFFLPLYPFSSPFLSPSPSALHLRSFFFSPPNPHLSLHSLSLLLSPIPFFLSVSPHPLPLPALLCSHPLLAPGWPAASEPACWFGLLHSGHLAGGNPHYILYGLQQPQACMAVKMMAER